MLKKTRSLVRKLGAGYDRIHCKRAISYGRLLERGRLPIIIRVKSAQVNTAGVEDEQRSR